MYTTIGMWFEEDNRMVCSTGNGSEFTRLAEIDGLRLINVDVLDNFPNISRKFGDLSISSDGILSFENYKYADGDPNCCPSLETEIKIRLSDMKILESKAVE